MKRYYHCALEQLAKVAGFRAEALEAFKKASHFKHTNNFILQVWEALYLEMLSAFHGQHHGGLDSLAQNIKSFRKCTMGELLDRVQNHLEDSKTSTEFTTFVNARATADDTWRLWKEFVFTNCMAYISL